MREQAVVALLSYDLRRFALLFARQSLVLVIALVLTLVLRPQRSSLLVVPIFLIVGSVGGLPAMASADKRDDVSLWLSRLPFSRSERRFSRVLALAIAWFGSLVVATGLILAVGGIFSPAILVYAAMLAGIAMFPFIVLGHALLANAHVMFGVSLTAVTAVGVVKIVDLAKGTGLRGSLDWMSQLFQPHEPLLLVLGWGIWLMLFGFSYWLLGVCLKPVRPLPS